jgi:hypothetical protein
MTALTKAARDNRVEEVEALIKFGANVNAAASDVSEAHIQVCPTSLHLFLCCVKKSFVLAKCLFSFCI